MKRTLFEVILVIALGVAGYFAWSQHKASGSAGGQLKELTEQKSELQGKLDLLDKQLAEQTEAFKALGPKAQQLDAARSALSGGQVLEDLEKLYAGNKKGLSSEQQLGLGVVRLLSKGPNDQGALDALNKTLEQIDWNRNQKIICATQNALAAAGKDVKVLAECAKTVSLKPETPVPAPAAAASVAPAAAASEAAPAAPASKGKDSKKP